MRYIVRGQGVPLGAVELPAGTLVAGRLDRWAMRRAAGLELELVDTGGETLDTTFVNLLAGSMDAGVVVVCCFVRTNTRNEAATEPAEPMLG